MVTKKLIIVIKSLSLSGSILVCFPKFGLVISKIAKFKWAEDLGQSIMLDDTKHKLYDDIS